MAHVSVQMAHDHMATAFHFLISKRGRLPASTSMRSSVGAAGPEVVATSVILILHGGALTLTFGMPSEGPSKVSPQLRCRALPGSSSSMRGSCNVVLHLA